MAYKLCRIGEISFIQNLLELVDIKTSDYSQTQLPRDTPLIASSSSSSARTKSRRKENYAQSVKSARLEKHKKDTEQEFNARVETLARGLAQRLDDAVARNPKTWEKEFRRELQREAAQLAQTSFGLHILHAIGAVYTSKAESVLGTARLFGIPLLFTFFGDVVSGVKDGVGVLGAVGRAKKAVEGMERAERVKKAKKRMSSSSSESDSSSSSSADSDSARRKREVAGRIIEVCWGTTKLEIVKVLRAVCDRVLNDPRLIEDEIRDRAKALEIVGDVFSKVCFGMFGPEGNGRGLGLTGDRLRGEAEMISRSLFSRCWLKKDKWKWMERGKERIVCSGSSICNVGSL